MITKPRSLQFGSCRMYYAGRSTHPEHNGQTWELVVRDLYCSRMTMHPDRWELSYHMGGSIFCPLRADFYRKSDAMYHALAMQAESFR